MKEVTRIDSIGPIFYVPLAKAEALSNVAFYVAAALSIFILFVDRQLNTKIYDLIQAVFAMAVICHFVLGIVIKIHFAARAHSNRVGDFVSNAFLLRLIPNPSEGYYNTTGTDPFVRMSSAVLENTLFTKSILGRMLRFERWRISIYILAWLAAIMFRSTDLAVIAVAAQVLFSEQLVSRWVRMEWFRARVEKVHEDLYGLFQGSSNRFGKDFQARVIQSTILYETIKAQAAISLSSKSFEKLNSQLSATWSQTRAQLNLEDSVNTSF